MRAEHHDLVARPRPLGNDVVVVSGRDRRARHDVGRATGADRREQGLRRLGAGNDRRDGHAIWAEQCGTARLTFLPTRIKRDQPDRTGVDRVEDLVAAQARTGFDQRDVARDEVGPVGRITAAGVDLTAVGSELDRLECAGHVATGRVEHRVQPIRADPVLVAHGQLHGRRVGERREVKRQPIDPVAKGGQLVRDVIRGCLVTGRVCCADAVVVRGDVHQRVEMRADLVARQSQFWRPARRNRGGRLGR